MRSVFLATILLCSAVSMVVEASPVLSLAPGINVDAFIAQVLAYEEAQGERHSTEESLRQTFAALDADASGTLDAAELSVLNLDHQEY